MDFLKSAVASAISKGPSLPFYIGDKVDLDNSIWALNHGTLKDDSLKCSVFTFDIAQNPSRTPLAQNTARKLKSLRHPGVLKVFETVESERKVYVATERVFPLSWYIKRQSLSQEVILWGLRNVTTTVKFLNENSYVHGNIRLASVFVSESGEWKLNGFDILSMVKDDDAIIYTNAPSLVPDLTRFMPPEVSVNDWSSLRNNPTTSIDSFGLGVLIAEIFGTSLSSASQLTGVRSIPSPLEPSYKRLILQDPRARLSAEGLLQVGSRPNGFFTSKLITFTDTIEQFDLLDAVKKKEFMNNLAEASAEIPDDFLRLKLLPTLLHQTEHGAQQCLALSTLMTMHEKFEEDDWEQTINPVIIRLFGLSDRLLRLTLLRFLEPIIEHIPQKTVSNQIFYTWSGGFNDGEAIVREETLKSVLHIVPKLTARIVNGDLLRCLGKMANDPQEGIRTNTTIVLGKIARSLSTDTRNRVLVVAFMKGLRDPFVHARKAALLAISATSDLFKDEDCAAKLLPALAPALVDKDKIVRDQATKSFDAILARVRKYADTLPDANSAASIGENSSSAAMAGPAQSAQSQAVSWAGWAISSFANRIVTGAMAEDESASTGAGSGGPARPLSTIPVLPSQAQQAPTSMLAAQPPPLARVASDSTAAEPRRTHSSPPSSFSGPADDILDSFDPWDSPEPDTDGLAGLTVGEPATSTATIAAGSAAAGGKEKQPAVPYDDKGEPDFAGWLSAKQGQKKKPLPRGLRPASERGKGVSAGAKKGAVKSAVPVQPATAATAATSVGAGGTRPAKTTGKVSLVASEPAKDDDLDAWDGWD